MFGGRHAPMLQPAITILLVAIHPLSSNFKFKYHDRLHAPVQAPAGGVSWMRWHKNYITQFPLSYGIILQSPRSVYRLVLSLFLHLGQARRILHLQDSE